jgi:uncharacterized protein with PIN domain
MGAFQRPSLDIAFLLLNDIGNKGVFPGQATGTDKQLKELFFHDAPAMVVTRESRCAVCNSKVTPQLDEIYSRAD